MTYGVVSGLCCYAHYFVLFVVASHAIVALVRRLVVPVQWVIDASLAFVVVTAPLAVTSGTAGTWTGFPRPRGTT